MDRREYKQMMEQIRPAPELMERVLAEGQTERSRPMKHRIRAAGVAALAAALLMGTALAVNSGFLERYFKGDLSVVEPYIQGGESVSDGKFRLTLDSAVVDQYGLVAQVTLEALTDEGAAWLIEGADMPFQEQRTRPQSTFNPRNVWLASADYAGEQLSWRYCNASPKLEGEHSYSYWEDISLRTDRSVTTQLRVEFDPNEMEEGLDTLWIGVDCMGPKYAIRLPEVGSMGAVTVEPECKILLNPEWDRSATVHLLEFGPLSYKLVYSYGEWEESWDTFLQGEFFLKLKDGTRVLYAISKTGSRIRGHNCYTSMVGGAVTIGFGGSVGPEAPIVLTGSAIGSNIAQVFRLNYRDTTLLLGCGAAGALAAIFKAPVTGLIFVLIAAIILAMAVTAHFVMQVGTRHGARRTVPDFSGVKLDQAQRMARKYDLKLHINDSLFVPAYEGGIVLDQLPEGGVEVKPGRTVYITINSFRQKMVPVPYVAGRSLRQAKNMLEIAGLEIDELVYRADMATNYVLDEYCDGRPVAATSKIEAELGSGVTLYVGVEGGYGTTVVPRLVGFPLKEAKGRLWELGLNVGKVDFDEGINLLNQKDARVYIQHPTAERSAGLGSRVDLRLTLDEKKLAQHRAIAEKQAKEAAEERLQSEREHADSLAQAEFERAAAGSAEEQPADEPAAAGNDEGFFD